MALDQPDPRRQKLQGDLVQLLGSTRVYFNPPESLKLVYPCIIYERYNGRAFYANDEKYIYRKNYSVTVIDRNPDSVIPDKLLKLPYCSFDRHFESDNLHHWVYTLYY